MNVTTVYDEKRGCGWRKPDGTYLRFDGPGSDCGAFPIIVDKCPCCGEGIGYSRSFRWIQAKLVQRPCTFSTCHGCGPQKLDPETPMGLLFVGGKFYRTPEDFLSEAAKLGISRRLNTGLPRGFKVGETWVCLGMRVEEEQVNPEGELEKVKVNRIFSMFRPTRVEYVVNPAKMDDPDYIAKLERLEKKGYTLVDVHRAEPVTAE